MRHLFPPASYSAGDTIQISGTIEPGTDLYLSIAAKNRFAPKDTTGKTEVKKLASEAKKFGFTTDTSIPILYYMLTTSPNKFGTVIDKKFGGPSFFTQKGKEDFTAPPSSSSNNGPNWMKPPGAC